MSKIEDGFDMDLLDSTIDDLADYVGFEPVPKGDYLAIFTYEAVKVGENELPAIRAKFKITEVLQLAHPDDTPPAEGKEIGIVYVMKNKDGEKLEFSEGQLKKDILIPLKETFGGEKLAEILDNGDGATVAVTFGIRKSKPKDGEDPIYNNTIRALSVQAA